MTTRISLCRSLHIRDLLLCQAIQLVGQSADLLTRRGDLAPKHLAPMLRPRRLHALSQTKRRVARRSVRRGGLSFWVPGWVPSFLGRRFGEVCVVPLLCVLRVYYASGARGRQARIGALFWSWGPGQDGVPENTS